MAKMSDNLIGYGAAQVFDTSRSVSAYKDALRRKEAKALKADEKFMKSLSVDSKGIRSVDIPGYTEKYNEFLEWSANNQVDLKNPSKNPIAYQEFQGKKNELLQYVQISKEAAKKIQESSKSVIGGKESLYNQNNLNKINSLSETSIFDDNFNEALSFNLGRDVNAALSKIPVGDLSQESIFESEEGVKTTRYAVKEDALENVVNNFFNQYSIEFLSDFESEDLAKEFIRQNVRSRIKSDKATTREGSGGGLNIGFGGGSTGKVNYDVVNLSGEAAGAKYSDFGFQNAREISFGFIKGENKPITFTSKDGKQTFEDVIPKAIIVDPETGGQGFVFYKPGKELSETERNDAIATKKSALIAEGVSSDEAQAQAIEYADALETGAEFSVSDVPEGQINVHYDNLYKRLKKGGLFEATKKEEINNNDPLGLGL